MSSLRKTYILPPSWDIASKEVELGSVIANVTAPHNPVNKTSLRQHIDTPIQNQKASASGTITKSTEWTVGLFANFFQVVTLGGDVSHSRFSSSETNYSCEVVETTRFQPSQLYLKEVAGDTDVQNYLKMSGMGAKVFIVTGLKTARCVTITASNETRHETNVALGLEVPGSQANIGPKANYLKTEGNNQSTQIEGPIVFAFQVLKVRIGRKGDIKTKDYVHGAMLGIKNLEDYMIFPEGDDIDTEDLDDYGLFKRPGQDEETGAECDIVHQS